MLFFSQTSFQSKQFTRASLIAKTPTSNPPALKKNSLASTLNEYRTGYPFPCEVSTLSFCVSLNNRVWEWITNYISMATSEFQKPSLTKWGQVHNFSCENEFYFHENENHFHIKGWALNLVLIQRPGGTRKWPQLPQAWGSRTSVQVNRGWYFQLLQEEIIFFPTHKCHKPRKHLFQSRHGRFFGTFASGITHKSHKDSSRLQMAILQRQGPSIRH